MFLLALIPIAEFPETEGKVLGKKIVAKTSITITQKQKIKTPTNTPTPTYTPTPTPTNAPLPTPTPTTSAQTQPQNSSPNSQYTAEQIGETTFRIKNVKNDESMASAEDVLNALNSYRQSRGVGQLSWDSALADLSQSRVSTFASRGDLDSHAGFRDFMNNGGFAKAGFNGLGENSARLSGPMSGDRIIREIFGADAPHDTNQLNAEWTHAGAAISGNFVNINFGKGKR